MILGYWLKGTVKKLDPPWVTPEKHQFLYDYFQRVSSRPAYIAAMQPVPMEETKEPSSSVDDDLVRLAKRYFELSNQHDLATIRTMFACDAVYVSNGTGSYQGVEAIMQMKQKFFGSNPSVRWHIHDHPTDAREPQRNGLKVCFHFTMTWDGPDVTGVETVTFDTAGQIVRVDVTRNSSCGQVTP